MPSLPGLTAGKTINNKNQGRSKQQVIQQLSSYFTYQLFHNSGYKILKLCQKKSPSVGLFSCYQYIL
jgi:hypothetical protein